MKAGDIILLTPRKLSLHPRSLLTNLISRFDGKYTHTGLIYSRDGILYVREMEWEGVRHIMLSKYIDEVTEERISFLVKKEPLNNEQLIVYNTLCKSEDAKYDYFNLIVYQLIKVLTNKFIGRDTTYRRNCAEDTARVYNKVVPNLFSKVREITPNQIASSKEFIIKTYQDVI
jgi:hypothetical protein